jgi:SNF2 family DNA or RNA helicase
VDEANKFGNGEVLTLPLIASSPKQRERRLSKALEQNPAMLVITYDTARVAHELLMGQFPYRMIVADESHRLRGYKSAQTKACLKLASRASRRLVLTGTASLGDPRHLWGQLRFLGKFIVPKFWDFRARHVRVAPWNEHQVIGFKNMDLLNKLVSSVAYSREAEDCLDLPDRVFQDISVNPSPAMKRCYNTLIKTGSLEVQGEVVDAPDRIVQLGKLAQISSGFIYQSLKDPEICDGCSHMLDCVREETRPYTKSCQMVTKDPGHRTLHIGQDNPVLDAVSDLVAEHLTEDRKVIVWAKHREMLRALTSSLEQVCAKADLPARALRYTSEVKDLREVEHTFNTDPEARVLVAQISMGIGVTFNAPAMIYAELDWALDHWLQSLDRNFGIRAKGHDRLLVQTVTVRHSVMAATRRLLRAKINVADLLTKKPLCVACDQSLTCLGSGVQPYDPSCKWKKTASKTTIQTPLLGD